MRRLECVKCAAPLVDPARVTCDACRAKTIAEMIALRDRLKAELEDALAGPPNP